MNPTRQVIDNGAVAIEDGQIIDVGSTQVLEKKHGAKNVVDAENKVIMPGLIDCHTHAGHDLVKTIGENNSDWLTRFGELYRRRTTEGFWYAESLLSATEKIKSGTTCSVSFLGGAGMLRSDDPTFAERHLKGVTEVGIREILGIGPSGNSFPFRPQYFSHWRDSVCSDANVDFEQMLSVTEKVIQKWNNGDDGRVSVMLTMDCIAPTADPSLTGYGGRAFPDEDLITMKKQAAQVRELASKYRIGILAHAYSGVFRLARELGMLGNDVMLTHCTGLTSDEINIIRDTGTSVAHCPRSRSFMRARCPVVELVDAGVPVGLGSDGGAPDRTLNLFDDMRAAISHQRIYFKNDKYMPPGKALEMATIDAARALHLDQTLGSIEVGKKADIIIIDMLKPHLVPIWMIPHRVVYEVAGSDVDTVLVDGRIVMENRKMTRVDEEQLLENAQTEAEKFIEMADLKAEMEVPANFWRSTKY
jgi:cytosine/adenosine deaminase-related metal-dependent hydrolase